MQICVKHMGHIRYFSMFTGAIGKIFVVMADHSIIINSVNKESDDDPDVRWLRSATDFLCCKRLSSSLIATQD